ncbi:MAG: hypothetical protein U9R44_06850 [Candidatus Omnitrophota bacterium]|nr:hypothetical protein [Candidatus Omnitrophota bacterium]
MRRVLILLIVGLFVVSIFSVLTADAIDIYTFKKDRVDQELKGNRGYLVGTPPPAEDRRGLKRTLIGIDIEIPSGSSYEKSAPSEPAKPEKTAAPVVEKPVRRTKVEPGKVPKTETVIVEEKVIEEEWIK